MKTTPRLLAVLFVAFVTGLSAQTTPLRIEQTVEARFPHVLSLSHITVGEARVIVNIDADGKLVDWLVSGYTHKAFADEAVAVLKQWRYTAPRDGGQPTGIRTELRFAFEATGRVVSLMAIDTPDLLVKTMGIPDALVTPVCHPRELDRPIAPVAAAAPAFPRQSGSATGGRSVLIDFYVDESGQPRMPVVVNEPYVGFAHAAMGALNQWRFTTPTRAGKPVSVRVRQEFIFPGSS
jgi:outer membrane biosynthesis protein TonB